MQFSSTNEGPIDREKTKPWVHRFTPVLGLTALCWLVFVVNNLILDGHLSRYGIIPRHLGSLPGIIWSPFLHGSFQHLAANTLPLLVLGGIICARGGGEFAVTTVGGIFLGGALTWLIGRNACHIGASGLIFCYFGYLASLAYFNRNIATLLLSLICILGYGGMLRGILPTSAAVSWEGHVAGLAAGILLAWFTSKLRNTTLGSPAQTTPKLPSGLSGIAPRD
jgi:membrane associated rhomboid family serine protease